MPTCTEYIKVENEPVPVRPCGAKAVIEVRYLATKHDLVSFFCDEHRNKA